MDDTAFEKFLIDRYDNQVKWYDKKARRYRLFARIWYTALIVTSALTPVILVSHFLERHSESAQTSSFEWLSWLALASAVLNLVATGALKTFQFDEHWHRYRNTCEDLQAEKSFYSASIHDYSTAPDKKALFVGRVEDMIGRERRAWQQAQSHRESIPAGH